MEPVPPSMPQLDATSWLRNSDNAQVRHWSSQVVLQQRTALFRGNCGSFCIPFALLLYGRTIKDRVDAMKLTAMTLPVTVDGFAVRWTLAVRTKWLQSKLSLLFSKSHPL